MRRFVSARASIRRAVRISRAGLSAGLVRANSRAVERPMPEEAPVMRIVLPERRAADDAVAMVRKEVLRLTRELVD